MALTALYPGSNGNPYWTQGPPIQDAVMTVSYVKAYFNSTNSTRITQYNQACPRPQDTCQIPEQQAPPNPFGPDGNTTGNTFFFTKHNMAVNQTVYSPLDSGSGGVLSLSLTAVVVGWAVSQLLGKFL